MPAKDLGTKYTCFKCNTKFYDMKKPAPTCPKCGADQRESPALKAPAPTERRARAAARPVEPEAPEEADVVEAAVEDEEIDDDDEAEAEASDDE